VPVAVGVAFRQAPAREGPGRQPGGETPLAWDDHGCDQILLDAKSLTLLR
jgi:hypothetical protein